jgi:hypothetical protein
VKDPLADIMKGLAAAAEAHNWDELAHYIVLMWRYGNELGKEFPETPAIGFLLNQSPDMPFAQACLNLLRSDIPLTLEERDGIAEELTPRTQNQLKAREAEFRMDVYQEIKSLRGSIPHGAVSDAIAEIILGKAPETLRQELKRARAKKRRD